MASRSSSISDFKGKPTSDDTTLNWSLGLFTFSTLVTSRVGV
jgi:hypothetical protein